MRMEDEESMTELGSTLIPSLEQNQIMPMTQIIESSTSINSNDPSQVDQPLQSNNCVTEITSTVQQQSIREETTLPPSGLKSEIQSSLLQTSSRLMAINTDESASGEVQYQSNEKLETPFVNIVEMSTQLNSINPSLQQVDGTLTSNNCITEIAQEQNMSGSVMREKPTLTPGGIKNETQPGSLKTCCNSGSMKSINSGISASSENQYLSKKNRTNIIETSTHINCNYPSLQHNSITETKSIKQEQSMYGNVMREETTLAPSGFKSEMQPNPLQTSPSLMAIDSNDPTFCEVQYQNRTMPFTNIVKTTTQINSINPCLIHMDGSSKPNSFVTETKCAIQEQSRNGSVIREETILAPGSIESEMQPSIFQTKSHQPNQLTVPTDEFQRSQNENEKMKESLKKMKEDMRNNSHAMQKKYGALERTIDELESKNKALNQALTQAKELYQAEQVQRTNDKAAMKKELQESQKRLKLEAQQIIMVKPHKSNTSDAGGETITKEEHDREIKSMRQQMSIIMAKTSSFQKTSEVETDLQAKLLASEELLEKNRVEMDRLAKDIETKDLYIHELKTRSDEADALTAKLDACRAEFETERCARSELTAEKEHILRNLELLQERHQQLTEDVQNRAISQETTTSATNGALERFDPSQAAVVSTSSADSTVQLQTNNKRTHRKTEVEKKLNNNVVVTLKTARKFYDTTGEQFIEAKILTTKNIKNLNFAASLVYEGIEIALHNKGCLMMVDNDFVAEVEIQNPTLLEKAKNYQEAINITYRQLRIVRILFDDRLAKVESYRKALLFGLENLLQQTTVDPGNRISYVKLFRTVGKLSNHGLANNINVCRAVIDSNFLSEELKLQAVINEEEEKIVSEKGTIFQELGFKLIDDTQFLYKSMRKLLTEYAKHHEDVLMETAPDHMRKLLYNVSEDRRFLITKADLKLFADMASTLNKEIFSKPLQDLELRWIKQINSVPIDSLNRNLETTNKVYFFLCKSLEEIILQLSQQTGMKASDLLESNASEWKAIDKFKWETENLSTKCLERQYHFLFHLLKHFELGINCNRKPFEYKIRLLNNAAKSFWEQIKNGMVNKAKKIMGFSKPLGNQLHIPNELFIWYCLLDEALAHILPDDCDQNVIESTLQSYLGLVRETDEDQLEILRVATHNTIQFIVQVVPYMSSASNGSIDQHILLQQCTVISSVLTDTSNFRDSMNVFSSYWKTRTNVVTAIVFKMPIPEMDLLEQQLLNAVLLALTKYVEQEKLLEFFRTYEEFITDLNELALVWFIKSIPNVDMQGLIILNIIKDIDNKWNDTDNRTYQVVNPINFPTFCKMLGENVEEPKHYVIAILQTLLFHVTSQLQRECWSSSEFLSTADQLSTTCELISAIHRSFFYLGEQADYVSFELFYDESVKPFSSLMENSTSRQDFSTRVHLLKESFWFIRKQNEMDVDTVLQLYENLNPNIDSKLLREPYEEYSNHFESYMQMTVDKDWSAAVTIVANEVRKLVSEDMHFSTWDTDFKRHKVPQILAGLGSVWSILVSKDVSSTGKYLSPNCVQILCVLRLLSVDIPKSGIDKHLAQVLTGQGKSLVLALVAALLALTGHDVNVGCYSTYLVQRDQNSFREFYHKLGVTNVTYGSLYSLMEKMVVPEVDGCKMGIRDLVEDLIRKGKSKQSSKLITSILQNSVLLVDEVDIFFSKQFHGNTYIPALFLRIAGFDRIQEFIWENVSKGNSNVETISSEVEKLMQSSEFLKLTDFNNFINKNNVYKLLYDDGELKSHSNRSLFNEHINEMILKAIDVFRSPVSKWSIYKLNSFGKIVMKVNEEYVNWVRGYNNVFNYFRLKKNNFVSQINGMSNYGYVLIDCGSLSYAMLPMNYPLILGVSGTLVELNEHENQTINELYEIKQRSAMPTFYGNSNLRFDKNNNFLSFANKTTWRNHIFSQANKGIAANRAVLIFFDDDHELIAFKSEYSGQFDRLNDLTENTDDKEKCINESGIVKTITCATRGMGRGVDYKSSVMVEKNGGVHVIQTFFSMDVKEEVQIKGRTARQDNKGSYELILCREDLIRYKLVSEEIDEVDICYDMLAEKRNLLSIEENKSIADAIDENKTKHNATLEYMKSFFKS